METDLELYRVFCEVVKYGSISKAADSMYLSQSAVTQSIQKLEASLGGKVFYRNKTGVELTDEGKNLYEYIKDSIETMSNAEKIFSNYINLDKGKIRIGGGNSIIASLVMDTLVEFLKKYPNIELFINSGLTESLINRLSNGELDMVVLNLPYNGKKYSNIEIYPLRKSNYCFFASKEYVKKNDVKKISDISKCKLILPKIESSKGKILKDYCEEKGIQLHANYAVASSTLMKIMVLSDVGVGFTNVENVKDILDKVEIIENLEIEGTNEGIAVLKKNMTSKATAQLTSMIMDKYKK